MQAILLQTRIQTKMLKCSHAVHSENHVAETVEHSATHCCHSAEIGITNLLYDVFGTDNVILVGEEFEWSNARCKHVPRRISP